MAVGLLVSDYQVPPGFYIREAIEYRGVARSDFARIIGLSAQATDRLLAGESRLTDDIASRLEALFGTPAHVWMNLEHSFRRAAGISGRADGTA